MENKFNKFLTLLTILLFGFGQMWADLNPALPATTLTLPTIPTEGWKGEVTPTYYKAAGSNVYVFCPYELYKSVANLTWTTQNNGGNASPTLDALAPFPASSVFTGYKAATLNGTSKGPYAYRVTNCVAAYVYCKSGSNKKRTITLAAYEIDGEGNVAASAAASDTYETNSDGVISIDLNMNKEYYIKVSQVGSGSDGSSSGNSSFYMLGLQAPYKVTLDPDGGAYPSNTLSGWTYDNVNDKYTKYVTAGNLTLPSGPTQEGYNFVEWQDNKGTAFTSITISKDTTLTAQWTSAGGGCAATIPGNITKGTASGGTGIITLTAGGDIASGDTWYWQDDADGTATDKGSGKTKNVNAAGTYYVRSYNTAAVCWSVARSVTVAAEDLLTAISPSLSYDANVFVGNTLSPTVTGNTGSGTITYALNDVTPAGSFTIVESTGVVTAITAGGTATVTATIAASGNYAGNTATSGTITAIAAPTHLVENRLNVTSGDWSSNIYTNDPTNITSLTEWQIAAGQDRTAGVTDKQSIKNGRTHGIGTTSAKTDGYYMYLSFTIASGKRLKLSVVNIPVFGISANKTTEVEIEDANSTKISVTGTITQDADGNGFGTYDFSEAPYLQGAVTLKMWAYGATSGYRMKSPIYLDGAISDIPVATAPSITAPMTDQSATYDLNDVITPLEVTATGYPAPTYQWYKNSSATTEGATLIASAESASYTPANNVASDFYYYCVATNASGSATSPYFHVTVNSCTPPATPVDLIVESKTHTTARISWDPLGAGANGYKITLVSATGAGTFDWKDENTNAYYEATGLTPNTGYTFKVKYKGTGSQCEFSSEVTVDFTTSTIPTYDVTFNLHGHGDPIAPQNIIDGGKVTKPSDPYEIGWDFGGWYKEVGCTNEWDFASDVVTTDTELFAKWTAFTGCIEAFPATSGVAPAAEGDEINMQTGSHGLTMTALAKPAKLLYTVYGLQFSGESGVKANVVLNNDMTVGTKIKLTLVANGTGTRGLNLYTKTGTKIDAFTCWVDGVNPATNGAEATFIYTVVADDGLDGTNEFQLWRNNTVCLKGLKVESCGAAVVYHNLTSAITPDHDPAYATVTLGASSVREGLTTTATYSAIDPAYEFDEWQISGTGASLDDASANPVTVTMGTADAVVTLKLKVATPKHTVTFNKNGKGADVPSQLVKEGDLVEEPSVTEPEGWILEGWYKEEGLVNKWNFASDVMGTSNIELFANWVADTSIKLINKSTGAINTTDFTTAVAANANVDGEKGAVYSSARTALTAVSALGEMVQYNATTNQTKIQLSMYNTSSVAKTIYLFKVAEGDEAATVTEIPIDGSSRLTTEYYTFNSDKNRSFYVTVSDVKVQILQVRVVDDGATPMKQFGQAGYSLNMNKGRMFAKNDDSAYPFEGGAIKVSSDYKVLNNSNLATKSYIQFNNAVANMILRVTRSGGTYYVSQDPDNKGTSYNTNQDIVLNATGTWYLGSTSSGSSASFTKIEFIAPKCAEPSFDALANSDICSGDPYEALDGTATVSDGGEPTYKWYAEGADESDPTSVLATTPTYTPEADGNYYVIATNHKAGFTDNEKKSDLVSVTTHAGTAITAYANAAGAVGANKTLSITASGKGTLTYQWQACDEYGVVSDPTVLGTEATYAVTITAAPQYYLATVHGGCGDVTQVLYAKEWADVELQDVTGSMTWNLHKTQNPDAWTGIDGDITVSSTSVLANVNYGQIPNNANFRSDMLKLVVGTVETKIRKGTDNGVIQGNEIMFHTTVPGMVRVTYRGTGNDANVTLTIGSETLPTYKGGFTTSKKVFVPAGDVVISSGSDAFRIQKIEFNATPDYTRTGLTVGKYGTTCLPSNVPAGAIFGAEVYKLLYWKYGTSYADCQMVEFEQVEAMNAGEPYLILPTEETFAVFYGDITVAYPQMMSNGFIGTFVEIAAAPDNVLVGKYGIVNNMVQKLGENCHSAPNRAYIDLSQTPSQSVYESTHPMTSTHPKRLSLGHKSPQITTGLDAINVDAEGIQKVLVNGQLYIVRGGQIYTATGQLVK